MAITRIVQREGAVWVTRASHRGRALASFKTQQEAIEAAREDLRISGGTLHVFKADGEPRSAERVRAAAPAGQVPSADAGEPRPAKADRAARTGIILAVIGVAVAVIAIPLSIFGPGWAAQLATAPVEDRLSELHAGQNLSSIEAVVGAPTSSATIDADAGWTRTVYVRDRYAVAAVADAEDQIVVLAVLNCGPHWDATFTTPSGTTIELGKDPLAVAEKTRSEVDVNDRTLYYFETQTGQAESTFLELTGTGPASGTGWLSYAVGFSSLCGTEPPDGLFSIDRAGYVGPASDAPADVQDFRAAYAPNFYIEIDENDSPLTIDEYASGQFYVDGAPVEGVELAFNPEDFRGEFPR